MHVLYVDANPDGRGLRTAFVDRTTDTVDGQPADTVDVTTASSAHDGLDCLEAASIDCVVSGDDMPGMDGLEFLEAVRERDPTLPFILFPENGSEALASEAISADVTDYVRRGTDTDQYATLADRIETAVEKRHTDRLRADQTRHQRERERGREPPTDERIIELVPTALFTLDETGTLSWLNDDFADPFEESKAQLQGTSFRTLVERGYYDERVTRTYAEKLRTLLSSATDTQRATYTVRFRSADGGVEIHDVHTQLLPLEDGEFAGTIHAVRDITQRRRHRRELERQNERLETFASLISHDLRNPLNVAQGNLEIHSKHCDEVDDHIERVHTSLDRMNDLIDDLLSLARHGRTVGEPDVVSLSELSRDAWNAVETGDSTLALEADGSILADAGRTQELLENLFRNAVEHGGEALTVTVDTVSDDDAMETGLVVADDGTGFPDGEPIEALFEFGHTTSESGTGLGLAIVREIADAHGWTTTATDSAAGGARFEFRDITVGADRDSAPAPADTHSSVDAEFSADADSPADTDPPADADPSADTDRH